MSTPVSVEGAAEWDVLDLLEFGDGEFGDGNFGAQRVRVAFEYSGIWDLALLVVKLGRTKWWGGLDPVQAPAQGFGDGEFGDSIMGLPRDPSGSTAWGVRSGIVPDQHHYGAGEFGGATFGDPVPPAWTAGWNINAFFTRTASGGWSVLTPVSLDRSGDWDVRKRVTLITAASWSVLTPLSVQRTASWAGRAGVSRIRSGRWDGRYLLRVTTTAEWDALRRVLLQASGRWAGAARDGLVQTEGIAEWSVLQRVTDGGGLFGDAFFGGGATAGVAEGATLGGGTLGGGSLGVPALGGATLGGGTLGSGTLGPPVVGGAGGTFGPSGTGLTRGAQWHVYQTRVFTRTSSWSDLAKIAPRTVSGAWNDYFKLHITRTANWRQSPTWGGSWGVRAIMRALRSGAWDDLAKISPALRSGGWSVHTYWPEMPAMVIVIARARLPVTPDKLHQGSFWQPVEVFPSSGHTGAALSQPAADGEPDL